MRERLQALDEAGTPIKVAVIGCGRFGTMMMTQIRRAPGMEVAVACDMSGQRAAAALVQAGYRGDAVVRARTASAANDAIASGRPVATDDIRVALESGVDVVVEATGDPDAGARHAHGAISAGKHIVMVNVEADVLVGPQIKRMADRAGVVYSLAYGDQPAIIEDLFDWAVSMGFEVVAAGKGTMYIPEFRFATPDDALTRYGYRLDDPATQVLNARMYNSFLDGTKSAVEMCAVANMTGLTPDVPGMHFPPASIAEIPALLIPESEGGVLKGRNVVEVVSSLRRDGTQIADSLRWGVFVVITSDSEYLRSCLKEYGVAVDPSGRYGLMYRPFHLIGMETPMSIAKAYLYREPTGAPKSRVAEVAAAAKRDLGPGETLDGEGGYTVYGIVVSAAQSDRQCLLPIGLSHGARVLRPVKKGAILTVEDVRPSEGGFAWKMRQQVNGS
ncbi:MAG: flagellar biosynthesis protein FlgA [SAR202 cluster bacterium]|nr:flagellar biosynthesis protein FlgA [SAR202 cluster bacterium]